MIKTIIVMLIVLVIAYFAIKKLLEQLSGKGDCICSECDMESKCNIKNKK